MAKARLKISLPCSVSALWRVVTDNENSGWRSDLSRIEVLDERRFVEYTAKGYLTFFTITALEPCKRYAFDMENGNMKGRWEGFFSEEDGQAVLTLPRRPRPKSFSCALLLAPT